MRRVDLNCDMGELPEMLADGSQHEVTHSSVAANEQFIIVVEPERLSISAGRRSLAALPGETVAVFPPLPTPPPPVAATGSLDSKP